MGASWTSRLSLRRESRARTAFRTDNFLSKTSIEGMTYVCVEGAVHVSNFGQLAEVAVPVQEAFARVQDLHDAVPGGLLLLLFLRQRKKVCKKFTTCFVGKEVDAASRTESVRGLIKNERPSVCQSSSLHLNIHRH